MRTPFSAHAVRLLIIIQNSLRFEFGVLGFNLSIDVFQGRRHSDALGDGETEAMSLIRTVVGVLPNDYDLDLSEGRIRPRINVSCCSRGSITRLTRSLREGKTYVKDIL